MSRKKIVIKMPSADQVGAGGPSPAATAGSHAEAPAGAFGLSADAETDSNQAGVIVFRLTTRALRGQQVISSGG